MGAGENESQPTREERLAEIRAARRRAAAVEWYRQVARHLENYRREHGRYPERADHFLIIEASNRLRHWNCWLQRGDGVLSLALRLRMRTVAEDLELGEPGAVEAAVELLTVAAATIEACRK